eukprot:m.264097 g.264097  ORF g.264097 m.264097 type:complete len:396 (+) comp53838_c0_seq1:196-1383(+)
MALHPSSFVLGILFCGLLIDPTRATASMGCEAEVEEKLKLYTQARGGDTNKLFVAYSSNKDGCVYRDDVQRLLEDSQVRYGCQWPGQVLRRFDVNNDGCLSQVEFNSAGVDVQQPLKPEHLHTQNMDPRMSALNQQICHGVYPKVYHRDNNTTLNSSSDNCNCWEDDTLVLRQIANSNAQTRKSVGAEEKLREGLDEMAQASEDIMDSLLKHLGLAQPEAPPTPEIEEMVKQSPLLMALAAANRGRTQEDPDSMLHADRRRGSFQLDAMLNQMRTERASKEKARLQSRRRTTRRVARALNRRSMLGVDSGDPAIVQRKIDFQRKTPSVKAFHAVLLGKDPDITNEKQEYVDLNTFVEDSVRSLAEPLEKQQTFDALRNKLMTFQTKSHSKHDTQT